MATVFATVSESMLEERRRLGHDVFDEMWEGVLHLAPPPSFEQQLIGSRLLRALGTIAEQRGLEPLFETGLYRPASAISWRVPDLMFARPEQASERGIEGRAELLVEIRSPGDRTYEKLPFYAEMEVQELLVVHPGTRRVELYVLRDGALVPASFTRSDVLGVTFETVDGPKLRITWDGGSAEL